MCIEALEKQLNGFTFYCSSIKTVGFCTRTWRRFIFTFYSSSIKTKYGRLLAYVYLEFTFYCSSIKTLPEEKPKDVLEDLHSTVVLLKLLALVTESQQWLYLHSTVVLLKPGWKCGNQNSDM